MHRAQEGFQFGVHQEHGHAFGPAAEHTAHAAVVQLRRPLSQTIALVTGDDEAQRGADGPVVFEAERGGGHPFSVERVFCFCQ